MKKSSHRAAAWSAVGFSALLLCGASCTGNIGEPDTTPVPGARPTGNSTGTGTGSTTTTGTGAGGSGTARRDPEEPGHDDHRNRRGRHGDRRCRWRRSCRRDRRRGRRRWCGAGGAGGTGGVTPPPFEPSSARSAVRKVKNLLTGLAADRRGRHRGDDEWAGRAAGLVQPWTGTPEFSEKMVIFFRNIFQQTGFIADRGLQAAAADQRRLRLRRVRHPRRRRRRVRAPGAEPARTASRSRPGS